MKTVLKFVMGFMLALSANVLATTTSINQQNQWFAFDVDDFTSSSQGTEWIDITDGSAQSFTFILSDAAFLRVVDAGYAGDRFTVDITSPNGSSALQTSAAVNSFPNAVGTDFDSAWANVSYSRLETLLAPGTYSITGSLFQAAGGGAPLNATVGALMLSPVPEPGLLAMMLAGLAMVGTIARRRNTG